LLEVINVEEGTWSHCCGFTGYSSRTLGIVVLGLKLHYKPCLFPHSSGQLLALRVGIVGNLSLSNHNMLILCFEPLTSHILGSGLEKELTPHYVALASSSFT